MVLTIGLGRQAAKVYRFLSRAYLQPPDRPYLEAVAAWSAELLACREPLPEGIVSALELIQEALKPGVERRLRELQQEYVRLFRGLSPHYSPPPPYESVYREGALWGFSTAAVRRRYREFGLESGGDFSREPPDQLGLELQFMSHLCERGAHERSQHLLQAQHDFLVEHLSWVGAFEERVRSHRPHPFYEGFLRLTGAWLKLHREHLAAFQKTTRSLESESG
ncbi:MAG: molecular chaperone [Candidatus Bipolaricaulia bacterium]